jgi:hypothetical protein
MMPLADLIANMTLSGNLAKSLPRCKNSMNIHEDEGVRRLRTEIIRLYYYLCGILLKSLIFQYLQQS